MRLCRVCLSKRSLSTLQQRGVRRAIEYYLADNDDFPDALPLRTDETDEEIQFVFELSAAQADAMEACLGRASRDQHACEIGWEQDGVRETIRHL